MTSCLFGFPIFSDGSSVVTATLSGGSWASTLPLANLQDRRLAKVARSTNLLAASTQFDTDLGSPRGVRLIAIPKHTMSFLATIRIRASATAGSFGSPIYDSGTMDVWPVVFPMGSLPFGDPHFINGKYNSEDLQGLNAAFVHIPATTQTARYWRIEIVDTTNAAGYIDLARLVITGGYQPLVNMSYGAKGGLQTDTVRTVTDGGAAIYTARPQRRTFSFVLENQDDDEAMANSFEMQRKLGTNGQFFFVFDPTDTAQMVRRAFLAVLTELSALEYAYVGRGNVPYSLIEEL